MRSAGKPGDGDKHHHPHRELREHRHGEEVIPEEADRVRHIPTVPPPLQRERQGSSGQSTVTLTELGRQSKAKMRFQSFFISTTVHLFAAAASSATSSFPKCEWRS
jgi:hypothetical protein